MTQSQPASMVAGQAPAGRLSDLDNERAVDLIEAAERSEPHCLCGAHMLAVEQDGVIWLKCSTRAKSPGSVAGRVSRALTSVGHSRRRLIELPSLN